jgi:predicted NAD/FAD-dependent oxidoreductase
MAGKGSNGNTPNQVIIVGAGIAGLIAARTLQDAGQPVLVLEKSPRAGGRMGTRRILDGIFDHGAQYFNAREPEFKNLVDNWLKSGIVKIWTHSFPAVDNLPGTSNHPRYRGQPDMTAIPEYLSKGLNIHFGERVQKISRRAHRWRVHTQTGETFRAGALVFTPPLPESLTLLRKSALELPKAIENSLTEITYNSCIAILALTEKPSRIPEPGAIHLPGKDIRWICDNHLKGISPRAYALTIHTTPDFSQWYWHASDQTITKHIMEKASRWIDNDLHSTQVMRWRCAQARQTYLHPCLLLPGPPPLVLAGDAFHPGNVEGAAISGLKAAESLLA